MAVVLDGKQTRQTTDSYPPEEKGNANSPSGFASLPCLGHNKQYLVLPDLSGASDAVTILVKATVATAASTTKDDIFLIYSVVITAHHLVWGGSSSRVEGVMVARQGVSLWG